MSVPRSPSNTEMKEKMKEKLLGCLNHHTAKDTQILLLYLKIIVHSLADFSPILLILPVSSSIVTARGADGKYVK